MLMEKGRRTSAAKTYTVEVPAPMRVCASSRIRARAFSDGGRSLFRRLWRTVVWEDVSWVLSVPERMASIW